MFSFISRKKKYDAKKASAAEKIQEMESIINEYVKLSQKTYLTQAEKTKINANQKKISFALQIKETIKEYNEAKNQLTFQTVQVIGSLRDEQKQSLPRRFLSLFSRSPQTALIPYMNKAERSLKHLEMAAKKFDRVFKEEIKKKYQAQTETALGTVYKKGVRSYQPQTVAGNPPRQKKLQQHRPPRRRA